MQRLFVTAAWSLYFFEYRLLLRIEPHRLWASFTKSKVGTYFSDPSCWKLSAILPTGGNPLDYLLLRRSADQVRPLVSSSLPLLFMPHLSPQAGLSRKAAVTDHVTTPHPTLWCPGQQLRRAATLVGGDHSVSPSPAVLIVTPTMSELRWRRLALRSENSRLAQTFHQHPFQNLSL